MWPPVDVSGPHVHWWARQSGAGTQVRPCPLLGCLSLKHQPFRPPPPQAAAGSHGRLDKRGRWADTGGRSRAERLWPNAVMTEGEEGLLQVMETPQALQEK